MLSHILKLAVLAGCLVAEGFATATPTTTASAAEVSASVLASLPACGIPCVKAALKVSQCELTDKVCVCQNTAFLCPVVECEAVACSEAENQAISTYTAGYCSSSGGRNFAPVCGNTTAHSPPPLPLSSALPAPATNHSSPANGSVATGSPSSAKPTAAPYTGLARRIEVGVWMVLAAGMLVGGAVGL